MSPLSEEEAAGIAPLKVLLVDDEPLALDLLAAILDEQPGIEMVGRCRSGAAALATLHRASVDVAFVDVQMPHINGFELIRRLQGEIMPLFVFVSAFTRYAVDAFEVQALDYLLKPISEDRVIQSLEKIRQIRSSGFDPAAFKRPLLAALGEASGRVSIDMDTAAQEALANEGWSPEHAGQLAFNERGRTFFLNRAEIDWIEAAGDYILIHAGGIPHTVRMTMREIEERLGGLPFVRVHRSTIVNAARIAELRAASRGDAEAVLEDSTILRVSRSHRGAVQDALNG